MYIRQSVAWIVFALALAGLVFASSLSIALAAPANTVTLTNKSGSSLSNYPLQFGRPFMQGEITNYPQVVVGGTAQLTQADVKNRWPDGSVKYAIISVIVPTVPASGSVTLSFKNQSSGNNTPLSAADMLASKFNFDAKIAIDGAGGVKSASARTMLQAGDYEVWTSGQIAQTILLADDSTERLYDMGFDSYKSLRPRFYATFWPSLGKVNVRIVGENSLTTAAQDFQTTSLTMTVGDASPATVYTKANLVIPRFTRFTKSFWIGGAPEEKVNVNHNLPYLSATTYIANYDPTMTVPEGTIASQYSTWQTYSRDLYQGGFWVKYMPTTGGRSDIGLMPVWTVRWLYTGDWRDREVALGQADLAGGWPLHMREGNAAMKLDKAQTLPGLGQPISVYAYPTTWIPDNNGGFGQLKTLPATPRIVTNTNEYPKEGYGWTPDGAHQPDAFFAQYILSGDYYYLEQMQLWASMQALNYCTGANWCRGPGAGIADQVRGNAWVLRNRTNTTLATPDASPLRAHFNQMTNDAIATFEGKAGITGTQFENTAEWKWGNANASYGINPLHAMRCSAGIAGCTNNNEGSWQNYYHIITIGAATDQGFPTKAYRDWMGYYLTSQVGAPGYHPYNIGAYYALTTDGSANWYPTWAKVQEVNVTAGSMKATGDWSVLSSGNSYPVYAYGASSFLTRLPNGPETYNFLKTTVKDAALARAATVPNWKGHFDGTDEISWNIVPRDTVPNTPLPPPTTPVAVPTVTLVAVPLSVVSGQSVMLAWTSTDATSCTGTNFNTGGTPLGTVSVVLARSGTFTVSCTGAGGTATAETSVTVTAAPTPVPTPSFSLGERVSLTSGTNVRATANGTILGTQPAGALGTLTLGPTTAGGYTWWNVNYDNAPDGYSVQDYMVKSTTPAPTPTPVPATPTLTFTVAPVTITAGQSSTLAWAASNVTSCTASGFSMGNTPTTPTTPTSSIFPAGSDLLVGTNDNDTLTAGEGITKIDGLGGTDTLKLTKPSNSANSSWFVVKQNADGTKTITDNHASGYSVTVYRIEKVIPPAGYGEISLGMPTSGVSAAARVLGISSDGTTGSVVVTPTKSTTYSVTCTGAQGSVTKSVSVSVQTEPVDPGWTQPPSVSFSNSPRTIEAGKSSVLSWSATRAEGCLGNGFETGGELSGKATVLPAVTTTYSLACVGKGTTEKSVTVNVTQPPAPTPTTPTSSIFPAGSDLLVGTNNNDTLTAGEGITKIDGLGGTDTLKLTKPNTSANRSWFIVKQNADGTKTITDNHASGYSVTVNRIEKVISPAGDEIPLGTPTSLLTPTPLAGTQSTHFFANPLMVRLSPGMQGGNVSRLQAFLAHLGYFKEVPTGHYGPMTAAAVSAFQEDNDLEPVGEVGGRTLEVINAR